MVAVFQPGPDSAQVNGLVPRVGHTRGVRLPCAEAVPLGPRRDRLDRLERLWFLARPWEALDLDANLDRHDGGRAPRKVVVATPGAGT